MLFTESKLKILLGIGIILFFVVSFWGLYSMPIDGYGRMGNCPFANGSTSLCQMNIAEHINKWQQLFTVIQEKGSSLLLLSLFILLAVLFSTDVRVRSKLLSRRFRSYLYKYKPELRLCDRFLIAFSQGILHPKIF